MVGTRYYWVSDSVWGTGQYGWLVLGGTGSERQQNIRVPNSTCLKLILSHALLIIATSFKVWNMQMIHTYAEKVWMLEDINFDTIFFHFFEFVVFSDCWW